MDNPLSPAVIEALSSLSEEQQIEVIAQAKKVRPVLSPEEKRAKLQELAGSMSEEDAAEMMAIIEEGCGQVNHASWE